MSSIAPNCFQVPSVYIDLLPLLTPVEFAVLVLTVRQTWSWNSPSDMTNLTALAAESGLPQQAIIDALAALVKFRIMRRPDLLRWSLVTDDEQFKLDGLRARQTAQQPGKGGL